MSRLGAQPTPGASGLTVLATRFWPNDRTRYCVLEYWTCGEHDIEECCSRCPKRVVAFRRSEKAAMRLIDGMLDKALAN
jgi:hypothetical protein